PVHVSHEKPPFIFAVGAPSQGSGARRSGVDARVHTAPALDGRASTREFTPLRRSTVGRRARELSSYQSWVHTNGAATRSTGRALGRRRAARTTSPSRRTPSSILPPGTDENDSRSVRSPLPSTQNAAPGV